jgi:hypothetical protein
VQRAPRAPNKVPRQIRQIRFLTPFLAPRTSNALATSRSVKAFMQVYSGTHDFRLVKAIICSNCTWALTFRVAGA